MVWNQGEKALQQWEPVSHGKGRCLITADLSSLSASHPKHWYFWNLDGSGRQLKKLILNNGAETESKPKETEWFFTGRASIWGTLSSDYRAQHQTFAQKRDARHPESKLMRKPTVLGDDEWVVEWWGKERQKNRTTIEPEHWPRFPPSWWVKELHGQSEKSAVA